MRIARLCLLLAGAALLDNCDDNHGLSSSSGNGSSSSPITAQADTWTWVPFDDSHCANGTSTGVGVNLHAGATRMLIYLEGGGACWDEETCYVLNTASYITTGYGPTQFQAESTDASYLALPGGFFDRSATTGANNPFQDYSYVYVPYCTGDVFAGDNTVMYGTNNTMQVGFANMTAFLKRIVPTAAGMDRIVLSGSSAGGFGAAFNLSQTQQAFGSTRVDLIDDSGTPMPADIVPSNGPLETLWFQNWNLAATLPSGCTTCDSDLSTIFSYYATALPNSRIALLSYSQDSVLPTYFSITTAQFTQGLQEVAMDDFDPNANLKYFVDDASGHVLWFTPTLTYNGTSVQTFLTDMESDSGTWNSIHPCGYVSAPGGGQPQPRC